MVRAALRVLGTAIAIERVAAAAPCEIASTDDVAIAVEQTTARLSFTHLGVTRVVTAATCAELADAVALIIAMADAPHVPTAQPIEVRVSSENAVTASAELTAPPASFDLLVGGAGARSGHGWQQEVVVGARWRRDVYSLAAEASIRPPETAAATGAASVSIWTAAATISPCRHLGAVSACALATAGVVAGAGEQLADARRAFTPLLAVGARLAWEQTIADRFALRLHVDALGTIARSQFDVDHMAVWSSDRFAAWAGVDALVHFP